ncbi:MAG: molybdopterin molybdotransferase MoeA [Deltaproteobacteria bacterium]|jgi:molybdopterin molybdotransferase/putative molybdopterin biosynthesis protein|nr:molybdopterin molybdotransferase MoeA [Deltaproteobacteria bacterium]
MAELTRKEEALEAIDRNWYPKPRTESVPVALALGRVPAGDVFSRHRLPVVRSAVMDGYAVRSADFAAGHPDTIGWALGREYVRADMGDDFDDAFDAVVLVEDVSFDEGFFRLREGAPKVGPGSHVRPPGSQLDEGEPLVRKGRPLLPKDLGFLQMGGHDYLEVLAKPKAAFIPTGSELISPGLKPARGQNVESNSIMVSETLKLLGAEVWNFPVVMDDPAVLSDALDRALAWADIVILNGGSSKGGEDHNAKILKARAKLLLQGVAAAPGKPLGIYVSGDRLIVNLPGPMIAAYYGLEWCLNHAVRKFLGLPPVRRPTLEVTLAEPLEGPTGLSFLFNLAVTKKDGKFLATPLDPRSVRTHLGIAANALYMTKVGGESLSAGQTILCQVVRPEELLDP